MTSPARDDKQVGIGPLADEPKQNPHPIRGEGEPCAVVPMATIARLLEIVQPGSGLSIHLRALADNCLYAHPPTSYEGEENEPSNITCQFAAGQPVSNTYKFDAEIEWLREAARYFAGRTTGGEDSAHWANVYNAENANKLASRLDCLQALQSASGK